MSAKLADVVASTIDQSGFSTAKELCPHQIHARRGNHAPIMADHTLAVVKGQFKPGVIGPITGGLLPFVRSMPSRGILCFEAC